MKKYCFLFLIIAATAQAQDGASIAKQGTQAGVAACTACHGASGEGIGANGTPALAGQSGEYLAKQLQDFASDVRLNPVMGPIAKALTAQERETVSKYYAELEAPATPKPSGKNAKSLVQLGQRLARVGDGKLQVQACNNCHGPDGIGAYPAIPRIAGQHSKYIEAQLKAWKEGDRKNQKVQMAEVAQRLDNKSMQALSAYFEQVHLK